MAGSYPMSRCALLNTLSRRRATLTSTRVAVSVAGRASGLTPASDFAGIEAGVPTGVAARRPTGVVARIALAGLLAGVGARVRAGVGARVRAGVGACRLTCIALRGRARIPRAGIGTRRLVAVRLTCAAGGGATSLLALSRTGVAGQAMAARLALGCRRELPPRLTASHAVHTRECETDVEVKFIVIVSTHPS